MPLQKNVYSTGWGYNNQLQDNTVQHLHYSGEMAATMDYVAQLFITLYKSVKNVAKVINLEAVKFQFRHLQL